MIKSNSQQRFIGFQAKIWKQKTKMLVLWRKEPQKQFLHYIKISQLQRLCLELQDKIETLENALNQSKKTAENRNQKQMVNISIPFMPKREIF